MNQRSDDPRRGRRAIGMGLTMAGLFGPLLDPTLVGRTGPRGSQWQCTECQHANRDSWKRCDGCDRPRKEVERS